MDKILLSLKGNQKTFVGFMATAFLFLLSFGTVYAQDPTCGCQDQVNVQLDDNCQFVLTIANVNAGDCGNNATVIVDDTDASNGNIIDCAGRWRYLVLDAQDNPVCWGFVLAEDKKGPVVTNNIQVHTDIECNYLEDFINNPNTIDPLDDYYLGEVKFQDNCSSCGCFIDRKFFDEVTYPDCITNNRGERIYAVLNRKWTATDCEGNQTVFTQTYNFFRPSLGDLSDLEDSVVQTCNPGSVNNIPLGYPYWIDTFLDTLYLNEVTCNYSPSFNETKFVVCDDGSYKLERELKVLDWCTGASVTLGSYIVKVGDFAEPEFTGNGFNFDGNALNELTNNVDRDSFFQLEDDGHLPVISTGTANDCTASFFIGKSNLERLFGFGIEDCGDVDINVQIYSYGPRFIFGFPQGGDEWRNTNYPMINGIASGVPVGLHALVISVNDKCKNVGTGVIFFKVKDLTPPSMQCDDQLNVSVTTGNPSVPGLGAYGRVDAEDVDEGSKDNCELDKLLVRRSVSDLDACEASFIALGYDTNNDGEIDANDGYDVNNNGELDSTEYAWEFVDGKWFTPWQPYVEFFCCDVDQFVTIELRGWDSAVDPLTGMDMPNFNTCWLNVLIEDDIDPVLGSLPDVMIDCLDPGFDLLEEGVYTEGSDDALLTQIRDRFGYPTATTTTCGNLEIEEEITRFLDATCKKGYIEREIRLTKTTDNKGTNTTTVTQRINVIIKHDYFICFPPDVVSDCDTASVSAIGITRGTDACDLFAVLTSDDRFDTDAGDPNNGCFKIFRTYTVINWCEYDGESSPVIVGRDWDGDFNTNPRNPDGDDLPGDEGICVIVKRDFKDNLPDTTYYDRDNDPHNEIPGDDSSVTPDEQGYWWRVISGSDDPTDPDYYDGPFDNNFSGVLEFGEETVWRNDSNDNGSYDDDDYSYGSIGIWQYTQHIKVQDFADPVITVTSDSDTFCSISNLDCAGDVTYVVSATDDCTATLNFTVLLDVNNTGTQTINVTNNLVNGTFSGRYPIGTHRLIFRVSDICGNTATSEKIFTVEDCLAPAPTCSPALVVNLSAVNDARIAFVEIWATDFTDSSPIGDCTGQGPELVNGLPKITKYSINRKGEPYDADAAGLEVTCADAGQLIPVEVHAVDGAGNHAFCNTFIEVQDNNNLCPPGVATGEIAGAIITDTGAKVADVEVRLSGPVSMMYMTGEEGKFSFTALESGYDYTIEPAKDVDPRNGVSIVDLIQIKKHVLGYQALGSPIKMIAADVNRSGSISVKDLLEVQKLILNKVSGFEGNTSWRFIDERHRFENGNDPWSTPIPQAVNINNFRGDEMSTDFIAVKTGDTNGDAFVKPRSAKPALVVNTQEQELVAGQEYTIYLDANLQDFYGLQFTLALNPQLAEIKEVHTALLSDEHLGVFAADGMVTAAWYQLDKEIQNNSSTLFGLTLVAKADATLGDILSINSRLTEVEAVSDLEDGARGIELQLGNNNSSTDGFLLYDNVPNPFKVQTSIGFNLPSAGNATLTIHDINGSIIQTRTQEFAKGYNQVLVNGKDLPVAGIYFYTVKSGNYNASKRFVYVK